jgi:hypothetical protein
VKSVKREKTNFPAENLEEIHRKSEKGQENVNCETPRRDSLFPPFFVPFSTLFLYVMQLGCSYGSPKVGYHVRCSKKTGVDFSGFYGSLSYIIEKGSKKGAEKGVKRTRKRETVNSFDREFNSTLPQPNMSEVDFQVFFDEVQGSEMAGRKSTCAKPSPGGPAAYA